MTTTDDRRGTRNPYVGPNPIEYGQQIYGRDREISALRDTVISSRIVLFYSPSGAGKSSLINAGLRPELEERDFTMLPTVRVGHDVDPRLGNRYLLSTLQSLEEARPAAGSRSLEELADLGLERYLSEVGAPDDSGRDSCLVFDQFEELFTLDPTDQVAKREFVSELGRALRDRSCWALFSMREDYIAQLDSYLALIPTRLATRFRLDLLGPEAAMSAARRPALARRVDFTEEAAARLVDNIRAVRVRRGSVVSNEFGPYVEPVVLQVVCQRLWERLDVSIDDTIDVGDIDELGDVDDALAGFCDDQITRAATASDVSEARIRGWVESELIGEQGFRTQVLRGPGDRGDAVIRALEDGHFLRSESRRGTNWYEIAHDRLVGPLEASNERWRDRNLNPVQQEADRWSARGRPAALLLRDEILAEAHDWAERHATEVRGVDAEFLESSEAQRRRVASTRRRIRTATTATLAILLLVVVALLVWALVEREAARDAARAEAAAAAAAERNLAAAETSELEARQALDVAQAAVSEFERLVSETQDALADTVVRVGELEQQLEAAGAQELADAAGQIAQQTEDASADLAPDTDVTSEMQLDTLIDEDAAVVAGLVEQWVPQLSAKRLGLEWRGVVFGHEEILAEHLELRESPGAVLVDGATYNFTIGGEPMEGWYITIVPQPFRTADGALDWCREQGLGRDDCFAKYLSTDAGLQGTSRLQP